MKRIISSLILLFLLPSYLFSTNFKGEDEVTIENAQHEDCYIGAGEIFLLAPVYGDFVVTAGEIDIKDSIIGDLLAFCGTLNMDGVISDDSRIAAGQVVLTGTVEGDFIFMGGTLKLTESSVIKGNLICFGGDIVSYGTVNGNAKLYAGNVKLKGNMNGDVEIKAGKIDFDAIVMGDMTMSADEIELGSKASCNGSIKYWHSDGEIDFNSVCSNAAFDESLAYEDKDVDWSILASIFGVGLIAYWIIFILSAFVVLLILEHFFSSKFDVVASNIRSSFIKSFGYGMLYFIGIPVVIVLCFITLIGFPLGVFGLFVYLLTYLFATSIIGLTIGHYFKNKSKQKWTYLQTVAYSLLIVVILKIIFSPPILGNLIKTISMAAVYGGFLMLMFEGKKKEGQA